MLLPRDCLLCPLNGNIINFYKAKLYGRRTFKNGEQENLDQGALFKSVRFKGEEDQPKAEHAEGRGSEANADASAK